MMGSCFLTNSDEEEGQTPESCCVMTTSVFLYTYDLKFVCKRDCDLLYSCTCFIIVYALRYYINLVDGSDMENGECGLKLFLTKREQFKTCEHFK